VGIESRVQVALDCGEVNAIVFSTRMVSSDQQAASRENG
jgi:hypothetical protein